MPLANRLRSVLHGACVVLFLVVFTSAARETHFNPASLIMGAGRIVDIVSRALPPDWSQIGAQWQPALETVCIALVGTVVGALLAIPLALLAARTIVRTPFVGGLTRAFIGLLRAVPDLVWALIFVTAVGLGPFPGTLALTIHTTGMLARLIAEMIEDMDRSPLEALELAGANRVQVFSQGVVPSLLPSLLGLLFYRFDENLRSSLVLGFVGAGGIGFQLFTAINLFQYRLAALLLLLILVAIVFVECVASWLRKRLN